MYPNDFDYDVIIIGGGISGLTAALNIIQRDPMLSVLILEANDSIGGRTKPIPMEITSNKIDILDVGGHFVSKRQSHLISLLKRLDLEILDYNFPGFTLTEKDPEHLIRSKGTLLLLGSDNEKDELVMFYKKLEEICNVVSMENPMGSIESERLDSITMEDFISEELESEVTRQHFRNIVRTTCGSEPNKISALFYLAYCNSSEGVLGPHLRELNGGRQSYIKGGIYNLTDKLISKIGENRILINTPVIKITRSDRSVQIYTLKGYFKSRCCILTIPPLNLLKITFEPPLNPGRLEVLNKMSGKTWIKFIATYKEAFWEKNSLNGDVFINSNGSNRPVVIILNVSNENYPALTGLVDVERLSDFKNHDLEILQQLGEYFGQEALNPLDFVEKSWPENFLEAPMSSNPDKFKVMRSFHEIRRPIGRLFFGGSETATYFYGHIGGAVQTGLRAALEVLYEIRPQVLCYEDFVELKPRRQSVSFYKQALEIQTPSANFGWFGRTLGGMIGTVGTYLGTDVISSVYKNLFGGNENSNNNTELTTLSPV